MPSVTIGACDLIPPSRQPVVIVEELKHTDRVTCPDPHSAHKPRGLSVTHVCHPGSHVLIAAVPKRVLKGDLGPRDEGTWVWIRPVGRGVP